MSPLGLSPRRLARVVALAVIIGIGIFNLRQAVFHWTLSDAEAYWNAALRLREGAPLYPALSSVDASEVYRYAPWFAWLAVPFTFLPVQVAGPLWSLILLLASGAALLPVIRARAWVLVALFLPILVGISAVGNVHALMIAWLVHGVERRSGPLWIALAASLKIFPILLAAVYAGRREWWRLGVTLALTGLLWAPALAYSLENYPVEAGQAASLYAVPVLWAAVVGVAVLVTVWLARGRYGWVAAATSVVLAVPRLFVYDVTYLLVGAAPAERVVIAPPPLAE
ncbi:MAG: glycosyltransferase 87 family protein [Chloroflexota bacterium]|nr:glycosyltransferase 87 family protein [Chloroflexota bacterium]